MASRCVAKLFVCAPRGVGSWRACKTGCAGLFRAGAGETWKSMLSKRRAGTQRKCTQRSLERKIMGDYSQALTPEEAPQVFAFHAGPDASCLPELRLRQLRKFSDWVLPFGE